MLPGSFKPLTLHSMQVRTCFRILDPDNDGRATLTNMVDTIVAIYKVAASTLTHRQ